MINQKLTGKTRRLLGGLAVLLAFPLMAAAPEFTSEPWPDQAPQTRDAAVMKAVMMKAHNDARRAVRVGPMVWNDRLAAHARAYAVELARTNRFEHSEDAPGVAPEGENLWMGTRGAFGFASMIGAWVDERRMYEDGTGSFHETGHYTQIIWRGSTQVGCALAKNASYEFLVCRYNPAGNVEGEDPLAS